MLFDWIGLSCALWVNKEAVVSLEVKSVVRGIVVVMLDVLLAEVGAVDILSVVGVMGRVGRGREGVNILAG